MIPELRVFGFDPGVRGIGRPAYLVLTIWYPVSGTVLT
jgi:hypothetical protein